MHLTILHILFPHAVSQSVHAVMHRLWDRKEFFTNLGAADGGFNSILHLLDTPHDIHTKDTSMKLSQCNPHCKYTKVQLLPQAIKDYKRGGRHTKSRVTDQ